MLGGKTKLELAIGYFIILVCLVAFTLGEDPAKACSSGWELCASTGECVPSNCSEVRPSPVSCGQGQIYCSNVEACVAACPGKSAPYVRNAIVQCDGELVYCMSEKECLPPLHCQDVDLKKCPEGTTFCVSTGKCQSTVCGPVPGHSSCPAGYIFCASSGVCAQRCSSGISSSQARPSTFLTPLTKCREGMIFCLKRGRCTTPNGCSFQNSGESRVGLCRDGEVFCISVGTCIRAEYCQKQLASLMEGEHCDDNKVFCLSSGTCQEKGRCGERPKDNWGTMCPRGYVYCIENQECVQAEKGCGGTGGTLKCGVGTAFCASKGQCSADCDTETVSWRPELHCSLKAGEFDFSNCITSSHCPFGFSCCPDTETLHLQCVGPNGSVPNDVLQTSSCALMTSVEDTSIGIDCTLPSDCPPASLCCDGTCKTPRGVNSCPPSTLYCSTKKSCVPIGSKCQALCHPGYVYCPYEGKCMNSKDCEFDQTRGAPWSLPGPVILTERQSLQQPEKRINSWFTDINQALKDTTLKVHEMLVGSGSFQTKREPRDEWVKVQIGSVISTNDFIRFVPDKNFYKFALAFLNVTEEDSGINRYIVQLMAPEPPAMTLSLRFSTLPTVEDELQMMTFKELFRMGGTDSVYWNAWKSAIDLPLRAASIGLLDFAHPNTVSWVKRLTRPNFGVEGEKGGSQATSPNVRKGIQIEYEDKLPPEVVPLISLDISGNGGGSWISVSPSHPTVLLDSKASPISDTIIRMKPSQNGFGNISFVFTPLVEDSEADDAMVDDDLHKLTVMVYPVNDAPEAITNVDMARIPTLSQGKSEVEFSAGWLANMFYEDEDGNAMGVVVISAQHSNLGGWAYSEDEGRTWKEINDLNMIPYKMASLTTGRYQGIIDLQSYNPLEHPQVMAAFKDKIVRDPETHQTSRVSYGDIVIQWEALLEDPAHYLGHLERVFNGSVSGIWFSPEVRIKFRANTTQPWTVADAISKTRLVIIGWDQTDMQNEYKKVQRRNISLPYCPQCGGSGSLSSVPASVVVEWNGCDQSKVVNGTLKSMDRCGRCGGNGQSCVDCHYVVNGTAFIDCGQCIGGTTGITNIRDCAGECGKQNIEKVLNGKKVCVHESQESLPSCDGVAGSGAYFVCDVCIGGTTGKTERDVIDVCGGCSGSNYCVGCDGTPNSNKIFDICGQCLEPNDIQFNKGCFKIGDFEPSVVDAAILKSKAEVMSFRALVVGISDKDFKLKICSFVNTATQEKSRLSEIAFNDGRLKAIIPPLGFGNWTLTCSFSPSSQQQFQTEDSDGNNEVTVNSDVALKVVDSSQVNLDSLDKAKISSLKDSEVAIKLKSNINTKEVFCILMYLTSDGKLEHVVKLEQNRTTGDGSVVLCKIPSSVRPGKAKIAIAFTDAVLEAVRREEIKLPSLDIEVSPSAPQVISALLSDYNKKLTIKFNVNIDMTKNCMDNFEDRRVFGEDPKCEISSDRLIICLGNKSEISNVTKLAFSHSNGIIQKYGKLTSLPPSATGSFMVEMEVKQGSMYFTITGDSTPCEGSTVRLEALLNNIINAKDYQVIWNISWIPEDFQYEKRETLMIWNSTREIQTLADNSNKDRIVEFPASMLLRNVQYLIVATLQGPNKNSIEPQKFLLKVIPANKPFSVNIIGPTRIYADKTYTYISDIRYCNSSKQNEPVAMNYFWSIDKDVGLLGFGTSSSSIEILPGTLRPKGSYTISLLVIDERQEPGLGNLMIETVPQNVKAIVSGNRYVVGSSSSFILDGSHSIDPSGSNQPLKFKWKCLKEDGSTCHSKETMERLETAIGKEDINSKFLLVPPILPPSRYNFTLEVGNDEGSSNSTVLVELRQGSLPALYISAPSGPVDVNEFVEIDGFVSSKPTIDIEWKSIEKPGFEYADIYLFSNGSRKQTIKENSKYRPFPLIIPPKNTNWEGLKPGAKYKFRLVASLDGGQNSEADVIIETKSPPKPGSFQVVPTEGKALVTEFRFEAKDWIDSPNDYPLKAFFGYRIDDSLNEVWVDSVTGNNNLSANIILTANSENSKLIPLTMVCDSTETCTTKEGKELTVSLPNEIPGSTLEKLTVKLARQLEEDSKLYGAMAQCVAVMTTLSAMGANTQERILANILENGIRSKALAVKERLSSNPKNLAAVEAANSMVKGSLNMLIDGFPFSQSMLTTIVSLTDNLIAARTNTFPPKDNLAVAARTASIISVILRNKNKRRTKRSTVLEYDEPSSLEQKRYKREASDTSNYTALTLKEVKDYIAVGELEILNSETQSNKTAAMDKLVRNIDTYLAGLCLDIKEDNIPQEVNGNLVSLRVIKSQFLAGEEDISFPIADANARSDDFIKATSIVTWGNLLKRFKEWECDGAEGSESARCYGACLATVEFESLFVSPLNRAYLPGQERGHLIRTALLHPRKGVEIVPPAGTSAFYLVYNLSIEAASGREGSKLKCHGWQGDHWSSDLCNNGLRRTAVGTPFLTCNCKQVGYVNVFSMKDSNLGSTSATTASTLGIDRVLKVKNITMKLDGNYNESVRGKEQEFEDEIRDQLANKLGIFTNHVRILDIREGSIIVDLQLIENEAQRLAGSAGSIDDVYQYLVDAIKSGDLVFEGLQNEKLRVMPDTATAEDPNYLPTLIGGIVGGVLLIGILIVILAIYFNKKKRMDKVSPLNGSLPPSYRTMHFEQSLEGRRGSLGRNRHYDNKVGNRDDDVLFVKRNSAGNSNSDSGFGGDDVPDAFRYRTPTKRQLQDSGPIPEHIVNRISESQFVDDASTHLPGIPYYSSEFPL